MNDFEHSGHANIIPSLLLIAATAGAAFGLGRLSTLTTPAEPLTIGYFEELGTSSQTAAASGALLPQAVSEPVKGGIVASKKGKAYHFDFCPGAKAISEENKIYFATAEEARAAGYEPAKNCKGLE